MPDPKPLTYERPAFSPVPRWQFRLLLLLVLLNLGITIQTAYAPGVGAAARQWWADRQARRRLDAARQQARAWSQPAGTVRLGRRPRRRSQTPRDGKLQGDPDPGAGPAREFPFSHRLASRCRRGGAAVRVTAPAQLPDLR